MLTPGIKFVLFIVAALLSLLAAALIVGGTVLILKLLWRLIQLIYFGVQYGYLSFGDRVNDWIDKKFKELF